MDRADEGVMMVAHEGILVISSRSFTSIVHHYRRSKRNRNAGDCDAFEMAS
jgi:hypothetical protein